MEKKKKISRNFMMQENLILGVICEMAAIQTNKNSTRYCKLVLPRFQVFTYINLSITNY